MSHADLITKVIKPYWQRRVNVERGWKLCLPPCNEEISERQSEMAGALFHFSLGNFRFVFEPVLHETGGWTLGFCCVIVGWWPGALLGYHQFPN
jgi:hypothetical protein